MKTMILLIFKLLICVTLMAPAGVASIAILPGEVIQPYEKLWEAICLVESGGNKYAIGDKHLKLHSYGVAQIRESRLDDYYRRTGIRYTVKDCFDKEISREIFMFYASPDFETCSRLWNGGANGMQKKSTLKYWNLIKAKL